MRERMLQKALKIVPAPLAIAAVAPPVLEEAEATVEYTCGHCGAALMRVDQSTTSSWSTAGLLNPFPSSIDPC
jgi:hypothetical protein